MVEFRPAGLRCLLVLVWFGGLCSFLHHLTVFPFLQRSSGHHAHTASVLVEKNFTLPEAIVSVGDTPQRFCCVHLGTCLLFFCAVNHDREDWGFRCCKNPIWCIASENRGQSGSLVKVATNISSKPQQYFTTIAPVKPFLCKILPPGEKCASFDCFRRYTEVLRLGPGPSAKRCLSPPSKGA